MNRRDISCLLSGARVVRPRWCGPHPGRGPRLDRSRRRLGLTAARPAEPVHRLAALSSRAHAVQPAAGHRDRRRPPGARARDRRRGHAIGRGLKIDLAVTPWLSWEWKALVLPDGGDVRDPRRNDQAGRVMVVFEGMKGILYVWDTTAPIGTEARPDEFELFRRVLVVVRPAAARPVPLAPRSAFVQGFMPTHGAARGRRARRADDRDHRRSGADGRRPPLRRSEPPPMSTRCCAFSSTRALANRTLARRSVDAFRVPSVKASGGITVERGNKIMTTEKATLLRTGGTATRCEGRGTVSDIDLAQLYDDTKSIAEGAFTIPGWRVGQLLDRGGLHAESGSSIPRKPILATTRRTR